MSMTAIVLAAGEGTRMKSDHPKVAHKLLDRPLVWWAVNSVREAGAERVVVVVGHGADEVRACVADIPGVECVTQTEQLGTGHACRCAIEQASITEGTVLLTYGDTPLVRSQTIAQLAARVADGTDACAVLTMTPPDCTGYGRVITGEGGEVLAIIEHKDCTPDQRLALTECNSGVYAFDGAALASNISKLTNNNAQGEYYLTDMVQILREAGHAVSAVHCDDFSELLGVNSRSQLAEATRLMQARINENLMDAGVSMLDPALVWVGPNVTVGRDTVLLPMTMLWGSTSIGEKCTVGPNTRLTNTQVGCGCTVDETVAIDAQIDDEATCGPRAYLRPGAHLMRKAKAGTHVEIKNSTIGEGSKVPHLSYIGDTQMGSGVNIGAGSITCNYDGYHKHPTTIGNGVFVGSDTMMVAPVNIGDGALIGAGSTITKDVPADALGLERSEQRNVKGYAQERRKRMEGDK